MDVSVSGYWILNMRRSENSGEVYDEWLKYPYGQLERTIIDGEAGVNDIEDKELKLVHALALRKCYKNQEFPNRRFIEKALQGYTLTMEMEVLEVLQIAEAVFENQEVGNYRSTLFEIIGGKFGWKHIAAQTSWQKAFNSFVDQAAKI